jgi:hypothetical protein
MRDFLNKIRGLEKVLFDYQVKVIKVPSMHRWFWLCMYLLHWKKLSTILLIHNRERERDRERERQRDRETEGQRDRETERQRDRETERQRERERERERDREPERQRDRETERQRDREAQIQRGRETEGQREKERQRDKYFWYITKLVCNQCETKYFSLTKPSSLQVIYKGWFVLKNTLVQVAKMLFLKRFE